MIQTSKVERRQILTIRVARPILDSAGYAHHTLGPAVVRSDLGVRNWPIHVMTIESCRPEIDIAKARRRPSPEVRLATNGKTSRPHPLCGGSRGEGNLMLPNPFHPLAVHVPVRLSPFVRIAEAAELHLPGLAVVAKVLFRIEPPSGIQRAHLEARFAKRFHRHAAACACPDNDHVIDLFWHGSPFRRGKMFVLPVVCVWTRWRLRVELQCRIVQFLVSDLAAIETHGRQFANGVEKLAA